MKRAKGKSQGAHLLRAKAEEFILKNLTHPHTGKGTKTLEQLLHELQVHQIELEMQNDELKKTQISVEKEKSRFADLFDLAPVGYLLLDENATIQGHNIFAYRLLSTENKSILNKRFQTFVCATDHHNFYSFIHSLVKKKEISTGLFQLINYPQGIIYCEVQGIAINDPETGKVIFYVTLVNVTEKRLAEILQRDNAERLQLALKAFNAGAWQLDLKSGLITLDKTAEELLEFKAGEFDGQFKTLLNKIIPDDRVGLDEALRLAVLQPSELMHDCSIKSKKGSSRYLEFRGYTALPYNDKETFMGLVTDITKRKLLEFEAAKSKRLQQRQMMKAIIETQENERVRISNALHDSVGQLLYGISLKLQNTKSLTDQSYTDGLDLLNQAIRETRDISFELAPSILTDYGLKVALIEMFKRASPANLTLEYEISGFEFRQELNVEVLIFRIVQELLNNAVKHSRATEVFLTLRNKKGTVSIEMTDNGVGFKESKTHRGIGLSSIKNRIALYNGTFTITSKKNVGTSVSIRLFEIA